MPKPTSDRRATERKHPWPMVRLGDVCEVISSRGHQIKQSEILPSGKYPVVSQSENAIEGFSNKEICIADVPIVLFGDHTCNVKLINNPFVVGADGTKLLKPNSHCVQYLYYCLQLLVLKLQDGKYRRHFGDLCDSEIPLPPLSVQREIVARLEKELVAVEKMKKGFEALAETAKAEFKAELKEVFEEISRRGAETRRLGEVCDVRDGTHDTPVKCDKGYLLLTSKNVRNGKVDKANAYYISASDYAAINKRSGVDRWDVLFSMIGTVGETAVVDETPDFAIKNMGLFKTRANELLARWIKYYFDSQLAKQLILDRMKGANQKFLSLGALREFPLILPNRDSMIRLVARLDGAKAKAEKLEAKAREGAAVCETMRKAILKEAFDDGRASPAIGKATGR